VPFPFAFARLNALQAAVRHSHTIELLSGCPYSFCVPCLNCWWVGRLHKNYTLFAGPFLGRIVTVLGFNVHCHLLLRHAKHVSIFALVFWANGEDVTLKVFASLEFRCLSRHIGWFFPGLTSLAAISTSCTVSSATGAFSLSHLKVESLGFSFLGIHNPLLGTVLCQWDLYKCSLQNVL
jgi:hypothetical protein